MRRALHQFLRKLGPAEQLAEAERIERGYIETLLRLTLLAPDLAEAILNGRQPEGIELPQLMGSFPTGWAKQRKALDAVSRTAASQCAGR